MLWMLSALANPVETIEGPRPPRDLWVAAEAFQGPLSKCFNGSASTVLLVVDVMPDGLVANAQFRTNDNPDPAVTHCLVSESLRMRLAKRDSSEPPSKMRWTVSLSELGKPPPALGPKPGEDYVSDNLDAKAVGEKIDTVQRSFEYCFNKEKVRTPTLAGAFDAFVTVDGTGAVQTIEIKNSTFPNDRAPQCIANKLRALKFPAPTDGRPATVARAFSYGTP